MASSAQAATPPKMAHTKLARPEQAQEKEVSLTRVYSRTLGILAIPPYRAHKRASAPTGLPCFVLLKSECRRGSPFPKFGLSREARDGVFILSKGIRHAGGNRKVVQRQ